MQQDRVALNSPEQKDVFLNMDLKRFTSIQYKKQINSHRDRQLFSSLVSPKQHSSSKHFQNELSQDFFSRTQTSQSKDRQYLIRQKIDIRSTYNGAKLNQQTDSPRNYETIMKARFVGQKQKMLQLFDITKQQNHQILKFILQSKTLFFGYLSTKKPDKSIDVILPIIKFIIEKNSIKHFEESIEILGDLFICCQDPQNAVNMYCIQKNLGDLTGNYDFKMRAFINLGNFSKSQQKYDQALKLFKKALEYAWFLSDDESETKIYERIGIIYFLLSNLEKALYYHQRSVNHTLEDDIGTSKAFAKDTIKKLIIHKQITIQKTISKYLLGKLGMIGNLNLEQIIFEEDNTNDPIHLKYTTTSSADYQISQLFAEIDFRSEIPSPQHEKKKKGMENKNKVAETKEDDIDLRERIIKQKLNISQKCRNNAEKVYLNPEILKKDLASSIQNRLKLENIKSQLNIEISNNKSQQFFTANTQNKLLFAHMTPNRSVEGFKFTYKYNSRKFTKFFEELISYVTSQQN